MKSGKTLAVLAVIATSILLTACLGTQDGERDSVASPLFSNQPTSKQVESDPADNFGAQSSQPGLTQERQGDPKTSTPTGKSLALSSNQAAPDSVELSRPEQENGPPNQVAGGPAVMTSKPEPSAQAPSAPSTLSELPEDTPLQSSKAVEVNLREFRQLLPRDAIAPIYMPQFLPANQASLEATELVIGVEIDGESKAYPIGPLVWREMFNDVIAGVPILVTW